MIGRKSVYNLILVVSFFTAFLCSSMMYNEGVDWEIPEIVLSNVAALSAALSHIWDGVVPS